MPRKTKCTPETQKRICEGIRLGMTNRMAAQYGGINEQTLYAWFNKGAESKEPYAKFTKNFKEAEMAGVATLLTRIQQAASNGTWQAAAWLLERRYLQEFGRGMRQDVTWNEPADEVKSQRSQMRMILGGKDKKKVVAGGNGKGGNGKSA